MTLPSDSRAKDKYDPTVSGAHSEIAKPDSAAPEQRNLSPEEKARAERVLNEFNSPSPDQRNKTD